LKEAQKSAEFLNEEFYILESTIALGDYYYNRREYYKDGLREYFNAKKLADRSESDIDVNKIERRIKDMQLRMPPEDFSEIEQKYA